MAGLGEMLAGGSREGMGLPPPEPEGEMGPAPQEGGEMPMEEAIAVMQEHQITPDVFPKVAMAVFTIVQSQQGSGGREPPMDEGPPPGPGLPSAPVPRGGPPPGM